MKILEDGEVIGLGEGETTKTGSEINGGWVMGSVRMMMVTTRKKEIP